MSSENVFLKKEGSALLLEERIGYRFQNEELLRQALSHLSYAHEAQTESNERLALLGDALLNALVTWKLYQQTPEASPGELTETRKAYVSQGALCRLAQTLDLERHLLLGKGEIRISPRMLADAFESLIGALFVDGGFQALAPFLDRVFGKRGKEGERW